VTRKWRFVAAMPQDMIPSESVIELNAPVMVFTLVVARLTALVFGLAPELRDLNDPLRDSGKGAIGGFRTGRMRDTVVVMEVAVSLTLLVATGALVLDSGEKSSASGPDGCPAL
jgi:hypothetical protein